MYYIYYWLFDQRYYLISFKLIFPLKEVFLLKEKVNFSQFRRELKSCSCVKISFLPFAPVKHFIRFDTSKRHQTLLFSQKIKVIWSEKYISQKIKDYSKIIFIRVFVLKHHFNTRYLVCPHTKSSYNSFAQFHVVFIQVAIWLYILLL